MRPKLGAGRILHQNLHEEAVKLGLGERIGAFHLDGVLRGHHQEWTLELMRGGAAGDGALLHGFEQRGLRLGGSAVDLVGQHQVGEDGSGLKAENSGAIDAFENHAADDVGWHEIGRELDPRILEPAWCAPGCEAG